MAHGSHNVFFGQFYRFGRWKNKSLLSNVESSVRPRMVMGTLMSLVPVTSTSGHICPYCANREVKTFHLRYYMPKSGPIQVFRFFRISGSGWTGKTGPSIRFEPGGQDASFDTPNTLLPSLVLHKSLDIVWIIYQNISPFLANNSKKLNKRRLF